MIDVPDALKVTEITNEASLLMLEKHGIKDKTVTYIKFNCKHCNQSFSHDNLNLSIMLYGVAFLVGPTKLCYIGITCPKCLNTILLKSDNLIKLQEFMTHFRGPNDEMFPSLSYHSSIIYSTKQIEHLKSYLILTWGSSLDDGTKKYIHSIIESHLNDEPDIEQNYLCSYINWGEIPIGSFVSVWWFKPDDIEALVKIENENHVRIFPRYVYKMSWYERYDYFCWRYRLYQDFLTSLTDTAKDTYNSLKEIAYQQNINLDKLYEANPRTSSVRAAEYVQEQTQRIAEKDIRAPIEFLDLLVTFDPAPLTDFYKGMWKAITPFKGVSVPDYLEEFDNREYEVAISDTKVNEMTDEIRKHLTQTNVQEWAVENHQSFIKDYISLARRPDFSYGYVWDLKCQYLKQLYEIIGTFVFDKTKYAFVSEHAAWRIKFDGEVISGLKGKGFSYLHYLVAKQGGEETDVFSLGSLDGDSKGIISARTYEDIFVDENIIDEVKSAGNDAINVDVIADPETKLVYDKIIADLKNEIKAARKSRDSQSLEEAEAKLNEVKKFYYKDFWDGKSRKFDDGTMKERRSIAKSISRAIDEIEGKKPTDQNSFRKKVASHFREALSPISLYKISYKPKEKINWMLE